MASCSEPRRAAGRIKLRCVLAVILCGLASVSQAQETGPPQQDSTERDHLQVPSTVIPGAITLLKARVGERFYHECITLGRPPSWIMSPVPVDSGPELHMVGAWKVYFELAVPSKPFAKGLITVSVDSAGLPVASLEITGIGRCVERPQECTFPIDEEKAREIARREGLEVGIKPWKADFVWNHRGLYLWVIRNTLSASPRGNRAEGRLISIDAATGEVYGKKMWDMID